jgi:hypothetical protein
LLYLAGVYTRPVRMKGRYIIDESHTKLPIVIFNVGLTREIIDLYKYRLISRKDIGIGSKAQKISKPWLRCPIWKYGHIFGVGEIISNKFVQSSHNGIRWVTKIALNIIINLGKGIHSTTF